MNVHNARVAGEVCDGIRMHGFNTLKYTNEVILPAIAEVMSRIEGRLAGQGRLLVRYSGTEPLLRVMLEGQHQDEIRGWAQEIVDVVKEHLG